MKIPSGTPVRGIPFVAFDTETTGLDLTEDRLLDVGAVRFRPGTVLRSYQSLVRPGRSIPAFSIAIHHITEAMVARAPEPKPVLVELSRVLDGGVLIAHNAPFDMAVLSLELTRQGLPVPDVLALDTCVLADTLMPGHRNLRLGMLMKHLGASESNDHRALPDARCCVKLFDHLVSLLRPNATWADLLRLHGPPFNLREFARMSIPTMWHFAVAVNAIEERRSVRIRLSNNGRREIQLQPRRFEILDGRWAVVPVKARPDPVYMDEMSRMARRPTARVRS